MQTNDLINGSFELIGAVTCWMNVFRLRADKVVRGVYWPVTGFFTVWGIWNLYYYPSLGQPLSFFGGLMLVIANAVWVCLAYKYRNTSTTFTL